MKQLENIDQGYFAAQFGLDDRSVRTVLSAALERGGDFAELFAQHKNSDWVSYEDGQVNRAYVETDLGVGIRVVKGEQTGYAFSESLEPAALLTAARTAASIATGAQPREIPRPTAVDIPRMYPRQKLWHKVPAGSKLELVRRMGDDTAARDPRIKKVSVHFRAGDEVVFIANSFGQFVEDFRPMTFAYVTCVAQKDGRVETNTFSRSARRGLEFYTDEMVEHMISEAVRRTLDLFEAQSAPAGEMPVVLAPATSGILLHEAMGHGFEADFNRKKISIFASMMGKKIAEDFVTIVDSGLEPDARGALNVDDEAVPGRRTVLVENGKLVSYLHDRISAKHFGVSPTGNGRREDFRCVPMPRMRVTTMEAGPHDPEEIVRSVKKGIYAVDFANGEVAIGAGDYSFYVKSGFLIENGRLTAPIKDCNLIGNGPDSLSKVAMVGNDRVIDESTWTCGKDGQGVPVGLGMPTVKVSAITVGGVSS